MLNFCYIYKSTGTHFEIEHSIRLVRKHYGEEAFITVIGDKCKWADKHINYNQHKHTNRAARVAEMLQILAKHYDKYILMYDDIFITRKIEFKYYAKAERITCNNSVSGYNYCKLTTVQALRYFNKPIINFDCHNPFIFESDKLLKLYELINWQHSHLPKSLYANYYELEPTYIHDLKSNEMDKVKRNIEEVGCFSTSDSMNHRLISLIKSL